MLPFGVRATHLHVRTHTTIHRWEFQHRLQRLGIPDLIDGDALAWEQLRQNNALHIPPANTAIDQITTGRQPLPKKHVPFLKGRQEQFVRSWQAGECTHKP